MPSLGALKLMVFAYKLCFIAMIQIHETLAESGLQCLEFVRESRGVGMSC